MLEKNQIRYIVIIKPTTIKIHLLRFAMSKGFAKSKEKNEGSWKFDSINFIIARQQQSESNSFTILLIRQRQ